MRDFFGNIFFVISILYSIYIILFIQQKSMNVDIEPRIILGACQPKLAYRAMQINAEVALVLPCNVVLTFFIFIV